MSQDALGGTAARYLASAVAEQAAADDELEAAQPFRFHFDARTVLHLGRDSIRDRVTALLELVKNAYDADADTVLLEITKNGDDSFVRLTDNGHGMSRKDLRTRWLKIGFSAKIAEKVSKRSRRRTGEKGIGRLACDRLGAQLELRTKREGFDSTGLNCDWDEFVQPGRTAEEISLTAISEPAMQLPPKWPKEASLEMGTQLKVTKLREDWGARDIAALIRELSFITPPFTDVNDFEIHFESNITDEFNGHITSEALGAATVEVTATLTGSQIEYKVFERGAEKQRVETDSSSMTWDQATQGSGSPQAPMSGGARLHLLFFPRTAETARAASIDFGLLREFLDQNAGVKIYRDNIRVRPYGDLAHDAGDWLQLGDRKARNPAGPSRGTFRVSPLQLVGAVFIGRDSNPDIVDSAAREGFVASKSFEDLKKFAMAGLQILETHYHKIFQRADREKQPTPQESVSKLENDLKALRSRLVELAPAPTKTGTKSNAKHPKSRPPDPSSAAAAIEKTLATLDGARHSIEELASQATVLRGLATVGIAATVFGHETPAIISQIQGSLLVAQDFLASDQAVVKAELAKALQAAERLVKWGSFALNRVRRDKRKRINVNIDRLVADLLCQLEPMVSASGVTLASQLEPIKGKSFAMDIESVVVNLVTNAFEAVKLSPRRRTISVALTSGRRQNRDGVILTVADSGGGVAAKFVQRVWEPLFTTKNDRTGAAIGTGLGLAIVSGIVDDHRGERALRTSKEYGGAEFEIWLPLA